MIMTDCSSCWCFVR